MSTKIYYAYRTKRGVDKWRVVKEIRRRALENVQARLRELFTRLRTDEEVKEFVKEELKGSSKVKGLRHVKKFFTYMEISRYVYEKYKAQYSSLQRSPWDLSVAFTVRHRAGRFYIIPYCGEGMFSVLNFLSGMDELEEYGYWNNTDKPDEVSEAAWNWRAKIWDDFIHEWDDCFTVDVLTPMNYIYKSPGLEMAQEEAAKKKEESLV